MLMAVKDFLAPTRGRILLFMIIFVSVFLYDTAFAPFPGSPVVENLSTQDGASSFVLYILLLPYILSCLLPAFMGLRKKRFIRLASLTEFMHPRHELSRGKPSKQQTFVFPAGTPVEQSSIKAASPTDLEAAEALPGQPAQPKPQAAVKKPMAKPVVRKPKPVARKPVKKASSKKTVKRATLKGTAKKTR
jgi:hypothetical protein